MKRVLSALLLAVPWALGWFVGAVVLVVVVTWLAVLDGYAAGRGR